MNPAHTIPQAKKNVKRNKLREVIFNHFRRKNRIDRAELIRLGIELGYTYNQIGMKLGVSKQRVHQLIGGDDENS